ncbi:hypothetical protein QOT17_011312 [Balamuthia mandrillaris]
MVAQVHEVVAERNVYNKTKDSNTKSGAYLCLSFFVLVDAAFGVLICSSLSSSSLEEEEAHSAAKRSFTLRARLCSLLSLPLLKPLLSPPFSPTVKRRDGGYDTIGDARSYLNHVNGLEVQLRRAPFPFPKLRILS